MSDREDSDHDDVEDDGTVSSSSGEEDDVERCPVCLLRFKLQPVGRPESCQHLFCLACITQWSTLTQSCPIDRVGFSRIYYRDTVGSSELGSNPVQPAERAEDDDAELETVCEECGRGDREHLLLLCDTCDRGYHTSCLNPALATVPPGSWHCQDCSLVRTPGSRRMVITRTGQLQRIRTVVDSVRRELERRFASHIQPGQPAPRNRRRRKLKKKSKKVGKTKKVRCQRGRQSKPAVIGALVDNVRAALGIGESVYNERPVPLNLFGNYNDLDPITELEEEEEELGVFSSGVSARVMPRHLAVERINLARRRRMKVGVEISPAVEGSPDILGGIIHSQASLFTKPRQLQREKGRAVTTPVSASTETGGQGTVKTHHSQETNSSSSSATSQQQQSSSISEGKAESGSGMTVSNCLVAGGGEQTDENDTDLPQLTDMGLKNLMNRSQNQKPQQSESEIYDPENPGEASDDENLVIDDSAAEPSNIPMSLTGSESADSKPNKIKISLTTTSATLGNPQTQSKGTPQKRSIISDIFGSDEEMTEPAGGGDGDSTPVKDEKKDIAEDHNNSENFSDVSDKEIDETKNERDLSVSPINSDQSESYEKAATLEGLNPEAISPEEDFTSLSEEEEGEIKNYEKRKQLKLKKRELQKKVKELERQVIEISPDAPLDLNGILEDGEINDKDKKGKKKLKEKAKLKRKNKKKLKVVTKDGNTKEKEENNSKTKDGEVGDTKDEKVSGRSYRKKKSNNEDEETDEKSSLVKRKDSKLKDKSKKPELQRYDVRRILDAKKEQKVKDKSGETEVSKDKENGEANKDEFGRDLSKKEKEKKRKTSSRSRSRGRKLTRRSRKRSTSSSSSLSLSSSSSSSNSSSSSSSSSSRSRSRKKGKVKAKKTKETTKNKKIVIKKKLPVAENIRKKMRSRSRSRNKRKRKPSESRSRSRSRSRGQKRKKVRVKEKSKARSKSRSLSKKRGKSKQLKNNKTRRRSATRSRSRSRSKKNRTKQRNGSPAKSSKSKETKKKIEASPTEKSVFTSGDKIMVSVNFPDNSVQGNAKDRSEKEKSTKVKANQKPSVIIDLLDDNESYKVIEQEKELVDIASDNEKENADPGNHVAATTGGEADQELSAKGPMTPPEPDRFTDRYDPFDPTVSPDNEPESLPVESQVTPPLQPSTPPGPPSESPTAAPSSPGVKLVPSPKAPNSNHKRRPLYSSLPPNVSAALPLQIKQHSPPLNSSGSPVDMDLDSPFSPGSASDLSDLFEPPSASPPTSSLPKIAKQQKGKKASDSKAWQSIIGESDKQNHNKKANKSRKFPGAGPAASKKNVNMKVVDDTELSSAVEMAVKEKFLKKVQRQDRIVEEVKLVLKPAYNTRKITKDAYKEILRKTVPKICHSKHGEINPSKIDKLVQGYIKKYQHAKRKEKKKSKVKSEPFSF